MSMRLNFLLSIALMMCACSSVREPVVAVTVESIVEAYPGNSPEETTSLNRRLLASGHDGIHDVCLLLPYQEEKDSVLHYALSGLAFDAAASGGTRATTVFNEGIYLALADLDSLRKMAVLNDDPSRIYNPRTRFTESQSFLIRLLELTGDKSSLKPLTRYIDDRRLGPVAIRTLAVIGDAGTDRVLIDYLDTVFSANRPHLINALGELRSTAAISRLMPLRNDYNAEVRHSAWNALAEIASPAHVDSFRNALQDSSLNSNPGERAFRFDVTLRMIKRLTTAGEHRAAVALNTSFLDFLRGRAFTDYQASALSYQVDLKGDAALPELLDYASTGDARLRNAALHFADRIHGGDATRACVKLLQHDSAKVKIDVLNMLARRGDMIAMQPILALAGTDDAALGESALIAAVQLDRDQAFGAVQDALRQVSGSGTAGRLQTLLMTNYGSAALRHLAAGIDMFTPEGQLIVLNWISAREASDQRDTAWLLTRSADKRVQINAIRTIGQIAGEKDIERLSKRMRSEESASAASAWQTALVRTIQRNLTADQGAGRLIKLLEGESLADEQLLISALGRIGGVSAIAFLIARTTSDNREIRDDAVRALTRIDDPRALPSISNLAHYGDSELHRILALRGYIRLVGVDTTLGDSLKLVHYGEAMELAAQPAEKRAVLSGVGKIRSTGAVQFAAQYLNDSDLKSEAGMSILTIARGLGDESIPLLKPLFQQIASDAGADSLREMAASGLAYMARLDSSEPAVIDADSMALFSGPLFNGINLEGWEAIDGPADSWGAAEGILFTTGSGGGWLSTASEYSNFELKLEFKLPPGGNSGVFLRAPHHGDPAYTGMEIQVLDDRADAYKQLKAWQYCGSLYAVQQPASRASKPAGEWQHYRITCSGPDITVELNGTMIIATSLIDHMDKTGVNPGLTRRRGYIGLQNHGNRIEFRNIVLTELP